MTIASSIRQCTPHRWKRGRQFSAGCWSQRKDTRSLARLDECKDIQPFATSAAQAEAGERVPSAERGIYVAFSVVQDKGTPYSYKHG